MCLPRAVKNRTGVSVNGSCQHQRHYYSIPDVSPVFTVALPVFVDGPLPGSLSGVIKKMSPVHTDIRVSLACLRPVVASVTSDEPFFWFLKDGTPFPHTPCFI